jgi:type I restriction enzyme S subunit
MAKYKEFLFDTIPSEWGTGELKEFTEKPQYGFTDSASNNGNAKFLRITDITDSGVNWLTVPFCNCKELDKYLLKRNDIVFARIGATTGKSFIVKNPPRAVYASYLIRVRVLKDLFAPFLFYYFNSKFYWKQINQNKGNNLKGGVNGSILSRLQIVSPLLPEQRKIAHILTTVQKAIEKQGEILKTTTELKKAMMQKLFTEGLHGETQKETEIGLVPESWEVKPLINVVENIDYGLSKAIPKNGVKIVSTADITREGQLLYGIIRYTDAPQKTIERLTLQDGDVLFNWRNSPPLIGKTTIFHKQPEAHIFASFILRINCGEKKSHNYYVKHLMNHFREEGVFVKLSRRAVNQANYNKNEISVLPIPVPEYNEQVEIANTINQIEDKINLHKSKKILHSEMFQSLINQLMTGQLRVNNIDFPNMEMN